MASGSSSSSKSVMLSTSFVPAEHSHHLVASIQQTSNQLEHLSYPNADCVLGPSVATLLNGSRYVCEACKKGFPRLQNLTLHRRVHKLPFRLRTLPARHPVKRKVYLCPEPTCQHHNRSHALGDFGGLKKHYLRKHCTEKNYQCDICSKMYAAETDLKAHSKVCGKRKQIFRRGAQFGRGNNFVAHQECFATQEHEAIAGRSSTLQIGDRSSIITNNNNNSHLTGSTTPCAPTFSMGADNSMISTKGKAVVGHSPTLQMGDRLRNNNFLIGSSSSYAPSYNMEESSMGNTSNDNHSSLIGLYTSHPDPHISAMQNLSKSYPFAAPVQSEFYPSGIDNGSLMTDPYIGSNLGQIFPDFFSPSTSQQNQHQLQPDFDSRFYTDMLKGKIALDNVNLMGDDMNIYGNGEGSSSNTINGVFVDQPTSHNLMPGVHNNSLNGMPNSVFGEGSSTFNQEFDCSYDQGSNYGYGDWNGQSDYGGYGDWNGQSDYGYGMEVSNFETSAATADEEAPYGEMLDQFRGFWF